jgi:hypothetical protein
MFAYTEFKNNTKISLLQFKPSPENWVIKNEDKYINLIQCKTLETTTSNT